MSRSIEKGGSDEKKSLKIVVSLALRFNSNRIDLQTVSIELKPLSSMYYSRVKNGKCSSGESASARKKTNGKWRLIHKLIRKI